MRTISEELERAEALTEEILKIIRGARAYLPVYSKEAIVELLVNSLRAPPSGEAGEVSVKSLDFRAAQNPKRLQAVSILGAYLITRRGAKYSLSRRCGEVGDLLGLFDTPEEGTAAAQSDYETRIRSALLPTIKEPTDGK